MSRTYYIAINWDKMLTVKNSYLWLQSYDAIDSCDIAQWAEQFPYSKGWNLYPFTRKKDRDDVIRTAEKRWCSIMEEK